MRHLVGPTKKWCFTDPFGIPVWPSLTESEPFAVLQSDPLEQLQVVRLYFISIHFLAASHYWLGRLAKTHREWSPTGEPATNVGYGREWSLKTPKVSQPDHSNHVLNASSKRPYEYPNLLEDHRAKHLWIWIFHVQFLKAASTWPIISPHLCCLSAASAGFLITVHGSVSFLPQIWVGWTFT